MPASKTIIAGAVVIILVLVWRRLAQKRKKYSLPRRLNQTGWSLYTMPRCSPCDEQIKILEGVDALDRLVGLDQVSDMYELPIITSASQMVDIPTYANSVPLPAYSAVKMFPMWFNRVVGASVPGVQTSDQLERMARGLTLNLVK